MLYSQPAFLFDLMPSSQFKFIYCSTKDNLIMNKQQGHILRTKTLGTDEGGVAAGFAALDSPYLI